MISPVSYLSDFSITADSVNIPISAVGFGYTDGVYKLTLSTPITAGQIVLLGIATGHITDNLASTVGYDDHTLLIAVVDLPVTNIVA
jgi:hypothetical protein